MTTFLIISLIIFFGLSLVWKRDDLVNTAIKVFLFGMGVWGLVLTLEFVGYVRVAS